MEAVLPETALVLVAVVTAPRDLEIARLLGWYRIPLRFAPKVVAVDYLAFYQTGAFGSQNRWKIEYTAPVQGYELTTRRELLRDEPDHPRANEEYYRVQLGPLTALPRPILADAWRRLTFLYTTGELVNRAAALRDLVVRSEERALLWQALREKARYAAGASELPEVPLDPALLDMLGQWD